MTGLGDGDADRLVRSARGLLLGLVLGDAIGAARARVPPDGLLHGTTASQLACFTVDGVIRASVRMAHKGICDPVSVVWHAYVRWAALQGIPAADVYDEWRLGPNAAWPDGWLARLPVLRQRRGSAPATVSVIQSGGRGGRDRPATSSHGAHAVTRTLPVGLTVSLIDVEAFAGDVAALTHAGPAVAAAEVAASVVAQVRDGKALSVAVDTTLRRRPRQLERLDDAVQAATQRPGDVGVLRSLASDRTSASALAGGLYAALSHPLPDQGETALRFAAAAPDAAGVGAVTGALLGVEHGPDIWPVEWLSRLELVWVADTLARDLILEVTSGPSGTEFTAGSDSFWWGRYPGW